MIDLPAWAVQYLGTVPQWGMLILLGIAVVRTSPEWIKAWFEEAKAKRENYGNRIRDLEQQVIDCRAECDKAHEDYRKQIIGMEAQRIQEQLSLISIIMQSVDNPMLKAMFDQLQTSKKAVAATHVGGPVADTEGAEHEGKLNEGQ